MIEAMACGTPVIARPCGSVPEVLRPGVTGLIASGIDDLVRAAAEVGKLSRRGCREVFEKRFTSAVMAANYERVYYRLIDERRNATAVTGRMEGRWTQRCETSEY